MARTKQAKRTKVDDNDDEETHFGRPKGFRKGFVRLPKPGTLDPDLCEEVFAVALPVILSYFEHPEARWYGQVSKTWAKSATKVQFVTPELNTSNFLESFLPTALEYRELKEGCVYEAYFEKDLFPNQAYAEIRKLTFRTDPYRNAVGDITGTWNTSRTVLSKLLSSEAVKDLKEGQVFNLKNEKPRIWGETIAKFVVSSVDDDDVSIHVSANNASLNLTCLVNAGQDALIERVLHSPVREGVCWGDHFLEPSLSDRLNELVNDLRDKIPEDYHPGSDRKVRDIVHPALYSYIEGVSPIRSNAPAPASTFRPSASNLDTWGRPYEDSKYQWLPTWVTVDDNMNVTFDDDINGLRPRSDYEVYECLERVLSHFIPFLEAVVAYGRTIDIRRSEMHGEYDGSGAALKNRKLNRLNLKSRSFQVIPKIVDYELQPGDSYEGVWHVEGMSHEHIVATCLYIASRDEDIEGGDLMFQRAWSHGEADLAFMSVGQDADEITKSRLEKGLRPLGRVATKEGRGIVFPNSHVHKVAKMTNKSTTKVSRRRIVVFFVVDPTQPIISTREVPDQREVLSREQAEEHRLALMHERKHHKQDWNIREIGLCEH